jgi:hypothetical protein
MRISAWPPGPIRPVPLHPPHGHLLPEPPSGKPAAVTDKFPLEAIPSECQTTREKRLSEIAVDLSPPPVCRGRASDVFTRVARTGVRRKTRNVLIYRLSSYDYPCGTGVRLGMSSSWCRKILHLLDDLDKPKKILTY